MTNIVIENLSKSFGDVIAADDVSFKVDSGKILTLLGPSGCGKTTVLRCICGLETPDSGDIYIGGSLVNDVPTNKRGIGMVAQTWAVWPHMRVRENLAFGLKIKKVSEQEIKKRIKEILKMVNLEGKEERYPSQLSGGEKQRVALARAIIVDPTVLFLDEPLSNLDAKLRKNTRIELKKIQKELNITTLYVTHDQEEALVIADEIAVMNKGKLCEVGSPEMIYTKPSTEFVADFIGENNIMQGMVSEIYDNNIVTVETKNGLKLKANKTFKVAKGNSVYVTIRPENIFMSRDLKDSYDNILEGRTIYSSFLGKNTEHHIELECGDILKASFPMRQKMRLGSDIIIGFDSLDCNIISRPN